MSSSPNIPAYQVFGELRACYAPSSDMPPLIIRARFLPSNRPHSKSIPLGTIALLGSLRSESMRSAPDLSAALVLLNRIGVNLNQIARTVNRGQGCRSIWMRCWPSCGRRWSGWRR